MNIWKKEKNGLIKCKSVFCAILNFRASAVMNYTELENKVREATNDEPWGPHGKLLNDLARETYDHEGLIEIMNMLLNRIFPENPTNWRRIYKAIYLNFRLWMHTLFA